MSGKVATSPRTKIHKVKTSAGGKVTNSSPTSHATKKKGQRRLLAMDDDEEEGNEEETEGIPTVARYASPFYSPKSMQSKQALQRYQSNGTLDKSLEGNNDEMMYQVQNLMSENTKIRMRLRQEMEEKYVLEQKVVSLTDKLIEAKKGLQDTSFALQKIQLVTSQLLNKKNEREVQLKESMSLSNALQRKIEKMERLLTEKQTLLELQAKLSREKEMREKDTRDKSNREKESRDGKEKEIQREREGGPREKEKISAANNHLSINELERQVSEYKEQISQLKRENIRLVEEKADMQYLLDAKTSRVFALEERLKASESRSFPLLSRSGTSGENLENKMQLLENDKRHLEQRLGMLERQLSTPYGPRPGPGPGPGPGPNMMRRSIAAANNNNPNGPSANGPPAAPPANAPAQSQPPTTPPKSASGSRSRPPSQPAPRQQGQSAPLQAPSLQSPPVQPMPPTSQQSSRPPSQPSSRPASQQRRSVEAAAYSNPAPYTPAPAPTLAPVSAPAPTPAPAPAPAPDPSNSPSNPPALLTRSPSVRSSSKVKRLSLPPVQETEVQEGNLDPYQAAQETAGRLGLQDPSPSPMESPIASLRRETSELFHQAIAMKKGEESEQEKRQAKRTIMEWYKQFVAENNREPTKMERDLYVGEIYKKYRKSSKVGKSASEKL